MQSEYQQQRIKAIRAIYIREWIAKGTSPDTIRRWMEDPHKLSLINAMAAADSQVIDGPLSQCPDVLGLRDHASILLGGMGTFAKIERPNRLRKVRTYHSPTDSSLLRLADLMERRWPTRFVHRALNVPVGVQSWVI